MYISLMLMVVNVGQLFSGSHVIGYEFDLFLDEVANR